MAFIKNTEREHLIKKVNRSYTVKKLLLLIDIVALLVFIILIFVSWWKAGQGDPTWYWYLGDKFTNLGIGMLIYALIILILGIICVILVFTIRSPKDIKKDIKKLESSALSGVKIERDQTAGDIMKQRRTPKKAKKAK